MPFARVDHENAGAACGGDDDIAIAARQHIGPLGDRDRPLGVLAQREARHAECGGLFLQAARIGEHQRGVAHQVAQRVAEPDVDEDDRRIAIGLLVEDAVRVFAAVRLEVAVVDRAGIFVRRLVQQRDRALPVQQFRLVDPDRADYLDIVAGLRR